MVGSVHELQVGCQVLVGLRLLSLKVEVEKVKVRALLVVHRGNHNETTPGRPVDGIAVLLIQRAEVLEVADHRAFGLFRAEESSRGLGGNSRGSDRLRGGDDSEAIALRLPSKVDDGILDCVNNLDRNTLLLDTEDLQSRRLGLLGLRVTVNLHTEIRRIRLPVQLRVADTEEIQGADNLLGRYAHQANLCRVAADLGCPETDELLVRLDAITLGRRWSPVEVHHALDLDAGFVEEVHARKFIYGDGLSLDQTCNILVIRRPLEGGPLQLRWWPTLLGGGHLEIGERAQRGPRGDVPDDIVLSVVVDRESWVALVGDRDGAVGPGYQVLLVRREGHEVDIGVRKARMTRP